VVSIPEDLAAVIRGKVDSPYEKKTVIGTVLLHAGGMEIYNKCCMY
jgi:hypothetical protein